MALVPQAGVAVGLILVAQDDPALAEIAPDLLIVGLGVVALNEMGDRIVGAMGISKQGLDFDTPDGLPVHCMVVLTTPENERDRHLQVLAALARAVGTDRNIQRQLFNAASPAHAYNILHAEDAQEFNYFLESEEETSASA
jgi:hypothetical protein